jgi:hypothetical protein
VVMNGETVRVPMTGGKASLMYTGPTPVIDPEGWVLRA